MSVMGIGLRLNVQVLVFVDAVLGFSGVDR